MRRAIKGLALVAALAVAFPAATQAQSVFFGVGGLFGVSDFGDATDPGFMGIAGIEFDLGESGLSAGAEGMYGTVGGVDDGPGGDLYSAMGFLLYGFGDPEAVSPYAFAGAGLLGVSPDEGDSETEFGYEVGVGLGIPVSGNVSVFIEGRYMGSDDVDLIGALGGLAIGLGG